MGRLADKVALITGAARGIGAAIARTFFAEDAFVYVTDINDGPGRDTANALGTDATYLHLDVREETDWQQAMSQVLQQKGRIDIVVNNAGITGFEGGPVAHDPENATLQDWHAVHRTNLDGVFLGCKHAIPAMRRTGSGLQRFGLAEEVTAVALLLASDEARYMTGAELVTDGGILAGSAGAPS